MFNVLSNGRFGLRITLAFPSYLIYNNYGDIMENLNKYLPFWDKLNSDEKVKISQNVKIIRHFKNTNVYSGYNDCNGILIVKTGTLRVYMLSEAGKEITLFRLHANDICILSSSCAIPAITFDVFIDTETDAEVLSINPTTFSELMSNNIYVQNYIYKSATEIFSEVMWTMHQILFLSLDKRLASFLLDEMNRNNNTISFTHEQIAKYLNSAREVITRMLNRFEEDGIISLERGKIQIVNEDKLKNIMK